MLKTSVRKMRKIASKTKNSFKELVRRALFCHSSLTRKDLSYLYIKGHGIEIGALHNPLKVGKKAKVKYVDRMSVEDLRQHYPELKELNLVNVDILDDGETLANVPDHSQDFVIANHFLEHCQNPIKTLLNMGRVLKKGGILYLALPDKRYTFDVDRPVTSLEHLLQDYREGPEQSKKQHFQEWVTLVQKVEGSQNIAEETARLMEKDYSIHFHVWTQAEMIELIAAVKKLGFNVDIELCFKNDSSVESIFILKKVS